MATALAATPQTGPPPSVLLNVTGAPNPPAAAYSSNFTAGADGWVAGGTGVKTTLWTTPDTWLYLTATSTGNPAANVITASRAITGLSVGVAYRFRATLSRNNSSAGNTRLRITGGVTTAYVALPVGTDTIVDLAFTATATSHNINIDQQKTTGQEGVLIRAASVAGTAWQGTRITRTDVNGSSVPVRNPGNLDTVAGAMALTDYEAALSGTISYTVTDGAGATATTSVSLAETRRNLAINPLGPTTTPATGYWVSGRGTLAATADGLRMTITDALVGGLAQRINPASSGPASRTPVTPGLSYTLSVGIKTNTAATAQLGMNFYDAGGALVTAPVSAQFTLTGGTGTYTRVFMTAIAPTGGLWLFSQMGLGATGTRNIGEWIDFQQVLIEQSLAAGVPFDGASPNSAWTGAVNNSASIQSTPGAASTVAPSLTLPATVTAAAPPAYAPLTLLTDYTEAAESQATVHTVLGRSDKLSNPGVLLNRSGTLELFCLDYDDAAAIRTLLRTAAVALLRQADYPGLDLYFVARGVAIEPAEPTLSRRWIATVAYDEVPRP